MRQGKICRHLTGLSLLRRSPSGNLTGHTVPLEMVNETISTTRVDGGSDPDRPEFFDGFLRPEILNADNEDNILHKFESMLQHEAFHFPVINAAPM